jgi:MoaA/NifB/PqqE/SkfB family radical SAM enzyme
VKAAPDGEAALSLDQIRHSLEFGQSRGARFLVIPGYGEPLLDPNFWRTLELARDLDIEPVVYTNGSLIDEEAAQTLKRLDVTILAKRNSFDDETQNALVRHPGASLLMARGLDELISAGFRSPKLALESYVVRPILEDLKEVLRFCRRRNLLPYFEAFEDSSPTVASDIGCSLLTDAELTEFFDELALIDKEEFGLDVQIPQGCRVYCFGEGMPAEEPLIRVDGELCCDRVFSTFCVAHTGDVGFCVNHRKRVGNINQRSLEEILDPAGNPRLQELFLLPCSYESARYGLREELDSFGEPDRG